MGMKFGIFDHIERRRDVLLDRPYRDRLDWVAQAEQAGFHGYHVAEHHHSPLCLAPNQAVYLAAVGVRQPTAVGLVPACAYSACPPP
jgi:alkanesulfonate monooxygenase SsuD/methylene tetrahydromethanopterin reductase-like flavin-dependent oxidoreductase (luciferase family)